MAIKKQQITLDRLQAAIEADDFRGFCLACGADADGVEPDARKYECDECGAMKVYGAEEVAMMLVP